jgi:hypothetical protein
MEKAAHSDRKRYEIVVRGRLSERFEAVLPELELQPRPGETVISGEFADQSHLFGVLERLREFGIEVVSFNPIR